MSRLQLRTPSFRSRLRLFFVVIVVVPMITMAVVLFQLIVASERSQTDARLAEAQTVVAADPARAGDRGGRGRAADRQRPAARGRGRRGRRAARSSGGSTGWPRRTRRATSQLQLDGLGRFESGGLPAVAPATRRLVDERRGADRAHAGGDALARAVREPDLEADRRRRRDRAGRQPARLHQRHRPDRAARRRRRRDRGHRLPRHVVRRARRSAATSPSGCCCPTRTRPIRRPPPSLFAAGRLRRLPRARVRLRRRRLAPPPVGDPAPAGRRPAARQRRLLGHRAGRGQRRVRRARQGVQLDGAPARVPPGGAPARARAAAGGDPPRRRVVRRRPRPRRTAGDRGADRGRRHRRRGRPRHDARRGGPPEGGRPHRRAGGVPARAARRRGGGDRRRADRRDPGRRRQRAGRARWAPPRTATR